MNSFNAGQLRQPDCHTLLRLNSLCVVRIKAMLTPKGVNERNEAVGRALMCGAHWAALGSSLSPQSIIPADGWLLSKNIQLQTQRITPQLGPQWPPHSSSLFFPKLKRFFSALQPHGDNPNRLKRSHLNPFLWPPHACMHDANTVHLAMCSMHALPGGQEADKQVRHAGRQRT